MNQQDDNFFHDLKIYGAMHMAEKTYAEQKAAREEARRHAARSLKELDATYKQICLLIGTPIFDQLDRERIEGFSNFGRAMIDWLNKSITDPKDRATLKLDALVRAAANSEKPTAAVMGGKR